MKPAQEEPMKNYNHKLSFLNPDEETRKNLYNIIKMTQDFINEEYAKAKGWVKDES